MALSDGRGMTEAEWLTQQRTPKPILKFLRGRKPSARKLRLFAAACCRRVWSLHSAEGQGAVTVVEQFADGLAGEAELEAAHRSCPGGSLDPVSAASERGLPFHAAERAKITAGAGTWKALQRKGISEVAVLARARDAAWAVEREAQAGFLRDIFASLVLRATVAPGWLVASVISLATAAYDERCLPSGELEVARLAVLSDALEEAGCTDTAILSHLRSPGPHVRGCWPLDLVLGKS
jgi:hypothetical protein